MPKVGETSYLRKANKLIPAYLGVEGMQLQVLQLASLTTHIAVYRRTFINKAVTCHLFALHSQTRLKTLKKCVTLLNQHKLEKNDRHKKHFHIRYWTNIVNVCSYLWSLVCWRFRIDGFVSNEWSLLRFFPDDDIAAAAATPIGPVKNK